MKNLLRITYLLFLPFLGCTQDPSSQSKLKKCDGGPQIMEIYSVTSKSAGVTFYGDNVFGLDAKVFNERGVLVSSASIKPENPEITVPLSNLKPGKYKLQLSGNTCSGQSEMAFTVGNATARTTVLRDSKDVNYVTRGYDQHLGVVITGTSANWIINDTATVRPDKGYEFRYMINGVILTQGKSLENYKYESNNPLRIWKMKTKIGLKSVSQWSDTEKNYFFDTEAGKVFSDNVTAGFCTVIFKTQESKNQGGFLNPVLPEYNPDAKTANWADIAPDMVLPKGHFWVARKGEWSIETIRKKGVTHISNHDLPWRTDMDEVSRLRGAGLTYNEVPRIEALMNLKPAGNDKWVNNYNLKYWPNGPLNDKEIFDKANETDDGHALWIGETMEGDSYMPPEQVMWGQFYKRVRLRYEAHFGRRKIPYMIAHNYFMFWPKEFKLEDDSGDRASKKRLFTTPVAELPKTNYSPGGTLSSTNLIMEAVYLNAPDAQNGAIYNSIFRMELFKKMGYNAGVFLFGVHEWRPNNAYLYSYPEGKYYRKDKLPLDPNMIIAYAFLSQIYGNLYVEWGSEGKQARAGKDWDMEWGSGDWYPRGARTAQNGSFPYGAKQGQKAYAGYNGSSDMSYFGMKLYNDTFGKVSGGDRKYLKFRIDGGPWINPSVTSGDNIVDAYYDKRGFVLSESLNGKTAWFYINTFADNVKHKLEVILPGGKTVVENVAGNGVHVRVD